MFKQSLAKAKGVFRISIIGYAKISQRCSYVSPKCLNVVVTEHRLSLPFFGLIFKNIGEM